jgi:SAM-dependent methyltransferase
MYELLKKLIPKTLIKRNEPIIRKFISLFYKGNRFQCTVCDFKMSRFITLKNEDKLCPKCGSLSRTRRLWVLLEPKLKNAKILHFSPSKSIKSRLESLTNGTYITTDYAGEFEAMKRLNIESIDEPDNQYNIVICYHVLEHIENDLTAMKELYRITKPDGICIVQTPFKAGEIYEDNSLRTEEERLLHFGQKDHVRIYSVESLIQRLSSVGFHTTKQSYKEPITNRNGFSADETIIIAKKLI